MKRAYLAALLLPLASCTGTNGEVLLGAPGSIAWFQSASPATIAAYFEQRCAAYGHIRGTPAMASCIQQEVQARQASNSTMMGASAALLRPQPQRPQTTTCRPVGNTVHCTTW